MRRLALIALAAGPYAANVVAADTQTEAWLIGGGPEVERSQGQIEDNVRWLESLLLKQGVGVRTYFALGRHPGKDVVYWDPPTGEDRAQQALARIFGDSLARGIAFKRHELRAVRGSTIKAELVPALTADFERHPARSNVLLVYNGHGDVNYRDTNGNSLRLWGDRKLDVRELDALLDELPDGTTTRFVMTQCYSGAFQSLVYEDPERRERLEGGRCGFFSESALNLAEGCDLAVDEEEYRDYSTFFFAALTGETRLGEPIDPARVDRDGDGRASFREAHLYTLSAAHSSDLPRSTSEAYLADWTPWYLRWDTTPDGRGSEYWAIAEEVAERYGWQPTPDALEAERQRYIEAEHDARARREPTEAEVARQQEALRAALATRWPELAHPYAPAYEKVVATEGAAIAQYLAKDAHYARLTELQSRLAGIGRETLDATRHLTQVDKIFWLRKLARLQAALAQYGSRRERRDYASLVECESGHLDDAIDADDPRRARAALTPLSALEQRYDPPP